MKYIFSIPSEHQRFVQVEIQIQRPNAGNQLVLHLPSWRPGRYELVNFAKNVKGFEVADESGKSLNFTKSNKDTWVIANGGKSVTVKYRYFCNQPDAGACFLDHGQLYINPVHCCMYAEGMEQEQCELEIQVPGNWKVATGLTRVNDHLFTAADFDRLADSPFIASPSLQHNSYECGGVPFHIWFQGECQPDWTKIIPDFKAFTEVQLKMMGTFPANDFHFLIQVLPSPFYHGVEHLNSTVLALGPGYQLMKPALYSDLMGVASHELFHCWNVKTIRPVEMLPYNFKAENYSSSGYVYEGVTTYYGDLFLARSGFFSLEALLAEFDVRLQKHMDNPGRYNYSVAESSFDTWLDGYVPGVPGRKTSIYDEGCLLAWILDFMIRNATGSKRSLDDVMRFLYSEFGLKNKGYSGDDFRTAAEQVSGTDLGSFFENRIFRASSLDSLLHEIIALAGLEIIQTPSALTHERSFGFKTEIRGGATFVSSVEPGSPAALAGLLRDDELIAINEIRVENNIADLTGYASGNAVKFTVASSKRIQHLQLTKSDSAYYSRYNIRASAAPTAAQLQFRTDWLIQK